MSDKKFAAMTNSIDGSNKDELSSSGPNIYFHPDTNELIFVPDDVLERENNYLCKLVKNKKESLNNLEKLIDSASFAEREKNENDFVNKVLNCHEEHNKAAEELHNIVKQLASIIDENEKEDKKNRSLLDSHAESDNLRIVELIKVQKNGGIKYRYVRSDTINTNGQHEVRKLDSTDASKPNEDKIIKRVTHTDSDGNQTEKLDVDVDRLKEAFLEIEPTLKYNLFKLKDRSGTLGEWAGGFKTWAEEINKSLDSTPPIKNKYASFDKKAQIMRWSYGGNGAAEISAGSLGGDNNRKASTKAAIYANFAFAEGRTEGRIHLPNRQGIRFLYPTRNPNSSNRVIGELGTFSYNQMMAFMGAFRFDIGLTLSGTVGASFGLQGSANLSTEGFKGAQPSTTTTNRTQLNEVKGSDITKASQQLGLNSEASIFIGAKGGAELAGDFLWYSPEMTPAQLKENENTDGFCSIAKVAAGFDAMLGGALTGQFAITYLDGKVYLVAHAELCWGVGAGGHLSFEVNMDSLLDDFMPCFAHMLRDIDYIRMLNILKKDDFLIICSLPILIIMGVGITVYQGISDLTRYLEAAWQNKNNRENLMTAILNNQGNDFKFTPPETKGAVIAALLQHEFWEDNFNRASHQLSPGETDGLFSARKRAILYILRWAQSQRDFDNIIQHLSTVPDGTKLNIVVNTTHILSFLSLGEEIKRYHTDRGIIYSKPSSYTQIFSELKSKLPDENLAKHNNGTPFKEYITVQEVSSRTLWSRDGKIWQERLID
ncbi:hypothetical protein V5085_00010 [Moellerella wisconsensis]|uniref:hypothetical protein n=1 Tax=Moellerella wisconsensis TaxID=158849 RepID=UPI0030766DA7